MHIVNRNEITHTLAERLVLAQINNPFIVPLKFSFQSEQKLYLVLASAGSVLVCFIVDLMVRLGHTALLMAESFFIICNMNKDSMKNALGKHVLIILEELATNSALDSTAQNFFSH